MRHMKIAREREPAIHNEKHEKQGKQNAKHENMKT
jgi:hypothetical protein